MKKILLTIALCYVFFANAQNQFESFENSLPSNWSANNGTLSSSLDHFKHGTKSLKWSWNSQSTITVNNPSNLSENSKNSNAAIWAWVYNENARPATDSAYFSFTNSSGTVLAKFGFCLNFTGWRFMWVCFGRNDLKYKYTVGNELTTMLIKSPASGSGSLYFDMVETIASSTYNWHRYSDFQYKVGEKDAEFRNEAYKLQIDKTGINSNDIVDADAIENRLKEWFLGNSSYSSNSIYDNRYKAQVGSINMNKNSSWSINKKTSFYRKDPNSVLAFYKNRFGVDSTGMGLHGDLIGYKPIFSDISNGCLFWLALEVAINNGSNATDLQKCIDIMDWMYNQGYAEGSGLGTGSTQLRFCGFAYAFFLLHHYIQDNAKYDKYMRAIKWITRNEFSTSNPGETADMIRGAAMPKLVYALCVKDPVERLAELRFFKNYMDNAVAIAPGFFGLIKPDYSVHHHEMPYFSEYGDDAIHQAALVLYTLRDTKFALSSTSYTNIKKATLTIADVSSNYIVPASLSGRFPSNGKIVNDLLQAMAYIGLSKPTIDNEVSAVFKRLFKPTNPDVLAIINGYGIGIQYTMAPGGAIALIDYNQKVANESTPTFVYNKFLPFSGIFAASKNRWAVSVKGFSKYVRDFECIGNFGRYTRYISYGNMQIMSDSLGLNNYTPDKSFDWIHFPGTTTIDLPLSVIDTRGVGNSTKERNLGDEPFLGGLSTNDTIGVFSMHMHDNTFDKTFRARKSVFYFGNYMYCMGSGITNSNTVNATHTTLFQNLSGTSGVSVDGTTVTSDFIQPNSNTRIITNSWGNKYIVFGENGDGNTLAVSKRNQQGFDPTGVAATAPSNYEIAWIDHGKNPSNKKYKYALVLNEDAALTNALSNTASPAIQVVRQETDAHIIYNTLNNTYGYSIFTANTTVNAGKLVFTSRPVIAMIKENSGDILDIDLTDPDLNRQSDNIPANVTITIRLNGVYRFISNPSGATISISNNQTTITQTAINGQDYKYKVGPMLNQTITMAGNYLLKATGNADFSPATASSGLPITYTSSNASVATIVNNQVRIVGSGFTTITASQPGNGDYNPASPKSLPLYVDQISIGKPVVASNVYQNNSSYNGAKAVDGILGTRWATDNNLINDTLELDLQGTYAFDKIMVNEYDRRVNMVNIDYWNGSEWKFLYSNTEIVNSAQTISFQEVIGSKVRFVFNGAAISIFEVAVFGKLTQTITLTGNYISKATGDADFTPVASASSGLAITYSSSNTSVATIVNNQVRIVGSGFTTIMASQSGNTIYKAAEPKSIPLYVNQISIGKSVVVSNIYQNNSSYNGAKAVDGILGTRWATDNNHSTALLEIDLGGIQTFDRVMLHEYGERVTGVTISYLSGSTWSQPINTNYQVSSAPQILTFPAVTGSKVRIALSGTAISVYELVVFKVASGNTGTNTSKLIEQTINDNTTFLPASVAVYPNPIGKKFYVSYTLSKPSDVTIDLLNINGQLVRSLINKGQKPVGKYNDAVEVESLSNAVYFVRFKIGDTTKTVKILTGK